MRRLGFTLIELLVTVAIAAILLALAVPSFRDFFERSRTRGAADSISSFVAEARASAVKLDRGVIVTVGGSVGAWCLGANAAVDPVAGQPVGDPVACDCTAAGRCMVAGGESVLVGAVGGVTVDAVGVSVEFDPKLGILVLGSTAGFVEPQVTLTSKDTKYDLAVQVSPLGHVRTCVPAGALYFPGFPDC